MASGSRPADASFDVAYTPGHASHHVSYFNAETGIAFVGDTAGIKRTPDGYVLPPTPPPDIDLERWAASLARIEAWRPDTLFLTHFGPSAPVGPHLAELRDEPRARRRTWRRRRSRGKATMRRGRSGSPSSFGGSCAADWARPTPQRTRSRDDSI